MNTIFLALYGLLFISGLFMLPAWWRIAIQARRAKDIDYTLVATALAINSAGTILVFGPRLEYGFRTGIWASVDSWTGWMLVAGISFFEISKIMLMLVRHSHGERKTFRVYAAASVLWAIFSIGWML